MTPAATVIAFAAAGVAAIFGTLAVVMARVLLDPQDLQVAYRGADGHARLLYFDTQYNDRFALLHQHAYDDALPVPLEGVDARRLVVKLLMPLDLAVSKLSRFSEQDQLDIRTLARAGLIDATKLRRRALAALPDYVGNLERIKASIDIACRLVAAAAGGKPTSSGKPRAKPAKK